MRKKDYSISFVRFIATVFIILCHMYQFFNNGLTFWFNVAVQMFFFISGYLYGMRKIDNYGQFLCKNFKKILVPYYLCVFIIGGIGFIFAGDTCGLYDLAKLMILDAANNYMPLHNLWFIAYILLCYIITPFFNSLLDLLEQKKTWIMVLEVVASMFGVFVFFEHYATFYKSLWILCYLLGILYHRLIVNYGRIQKQIFVTVLIVSVLITNGIDIYMELNGLVPSAGESVAVFLKFHDFGHVLLGSLLCLVLAYLYRWIFKDAERTPKWMTGFLEWSDKYSYDIYLVHQTFILGAFSFYAFIPSVPVASICIVITTIIAAILLHKLSDGVFKVIK